MLIEQICSSIIARPREWELAPIREKDGMIMETSIFICTWPHKTHSPRWLILTSDDNEFTNNEFLSSATLIRSAKEVDRDIILVNERTIKTGMVCIIFTWNTNRPDDEENLSPFCGNTNRLNFLQYLVIEWQPTKHQPPRLINKCNKNGLEQL